MDLLNNNNNNLVIILVAVCALVALFTMGRSLGYMIRNVAVVAVVVIAAYFLYTSMNQKKENYDNNKYTTPSPIDTYDEPMEQFDNYPEYDDEVVEHFDAHENTENDAAANSEDTDNVEAQASNADNQQQEPAPSSVGASEPLGQNEDYKAVEGTMSGRNQLPNECYPKDILSPQELLPKDVDSVWAQSVPAGQGSLGDKNFLNAGFHVGVNTVGQTLRNANRQIRSEPPNPQVKVSPWLQSTIEPDTNRKPLEIGA
jgi:Ca2+/Na+ antiporter